MHVTRREFVKGGVAAFTATSRRRNSSAIWRGRRARGTRNLVVLYLSGGNDALSMLVPYSDPFYYQPPADARRACRSTCCRSAADRSGVALGLHPRLTGLKQIFDQGRLALVQRTGYANQSRSHFQGTDIWSTADPAQLGRARLARPLSRRAAVAARSARRLEHDAATSPHVAESRTTSVSRHRRIRATYTFRARTPAPKPLPSARPPGESARTCPSIARTSRSCTAASQAALATLDRVATVAHATRRRVAYPEHRLRAGAARRWRARWCAASARRCSVCTTGGFDTHSAQHVNGANGTYVNLMATLNDALLGVLHRPEEPGHARRHAASSASRSSAAGSPRTAAAAPTTARRPDARRWAAASTAASTAPRPTSTPIRRIRRSRTTAATCTTRRISARSTRASSDDWLGADSRAILNGDFRKSSLNFI